MIFLQFYQYLFQEMTDQQEQEATHFKKRHNNLNLQILFLDEDSYLIKILNLQSLECFEQTINSSYLKYHAEITRFFETPKLLIKHLKQHFKDLSISDKGIIKFELKYSNAVEPKLVTVGIKKKNIDRVELVNMKMDKMKEELDQKESTIQQLREKIRKLDKFCEQSSKMLKNCLFYTHAHPDAYQNQYFLTKCTGRSVIVNHIGQNTNFIFVFNHEITVGAVKKYALKVLKSASIANVFFCFGSRLILSNSAFNSAEIASYQCNGNLYEGGAQRNIGVSANVGDDIECQLSLIDNRINWIKGGNQFATTTLPQQMRNKSLYFALIIHCKYDEVEVKLD